MSGKVAHLEKPGHFLAMMRSVLNFWGKKSTFKNSVFTKLLTTSFGVRVRMQLEIFNFALLSQATPTVRKVFVRTLN
jgi:hypothetical protein